VTYWQFNPYAIPIVLGLLPLLYVGIRAWHNRTSLTAYLFALCAAASCAALGFYILELSSTNTELLILWVRLRFVFILCIPILGLFFLLAYVGREEWVTWRVALVLAIQPCITLFAMWTNDIYHLQWEYYTTRQIGGLVFAAYKDATYSPIYWMGQFYLLFISGLLVYIIRRTMIRSPGILRGQVFYLLIAVLLPLSGVMFELVGLRPIPYLNWPVFTLCLAAIPLGIALFRYRLLDILPAAQSLVLQSMQDAVLVIDSQGRIVDANPAAATLIREPLSKIIGHHVRDVFWDVPHLLRQYNAVYQAQDVISLEAEDGSHHYDLRISPLRNRHLHITGRILVLRDVGAAKRAEQHALELALERERTQLIKSFISDTTHDIMTPISVIRVSSYLIRSLTDKIGQAVTDAKLNPAEVDTHLNQLQTSIHAMREKSVNLDASALRLQTLVEGMLEMVKLDRQVFAFMPTDINPLVEQTANLQRFLAEDKGIHLELQLDRTLPKLSVDSNQFIRVMQNLLTNALKYTPRAGKVIMRTRWHEDQVAFEVQDTGEGIPESDLPRIFDRLYRVDKNRPVENVGVGLGLGLSIVKTIVNAHQGTIEVESTVGVGSTFRVVLPIIAPSQISNAQIA